MLNGQRRRTRQVPVIDDATGETIFVQKLPHQLTDEDVVLLQQEEDAYLAEVEYTYVLIQHDYM